MNLFIIITLLTIFVTQLIIKQNQNKMKEVVEQLRAEVQETKGVAQSAKTLLEKMSAKLNEIAESGTMEDVKALVAELDSANAELSQAVADNALPEEPAEPDAE